MRQGWSSLGMVPGGTEIDEYPDFAVEDGDEDDEEDEDADEPPRILASAVDNDPMP